MQGIKIAVVGLEATRSSFTRLAKRISGKDLMSGVLSGAELIQNRAKELAPKLTGYLTRSIHIGGYGHLSPGFNPSEGYDDIGGNVETDDYAQVQVGTNVIYAPIQEFGGIIRAKNAPYLVFKTKDGTWHSVKSVQIPAHPYLRPAYDEKADACMQEVSDALDILIAEALK